MFGPSAFEHLPNDVSTAFEIFIDEKQKLLLIQSRSPITAFFLSSFLDEIIDFVKKEDIGELMILSSVNGSEQHYMDQSPFEYFSNDLKKTDEPLKANFNSTSKTSFPGAGISFKIHEHATKNQIPSAVLFRYTSEGENIIEAKQLCDKVFEVIGNKGISIQYPISWKHFFGFNTNIEIY